MLREGAEQTSIGQVIQLFRPPLPDEEASQLDDPVRQMWLESTQHCEQAWEHLTIAELAERAASWCECSFDAGEGEVEPVSAASGKGKRESG